MFTVKMQQICVVFAFLVILASELNACPLSWQKYEDYCFKKFPNASWDLAISSCIDQDARLAEVQNQSENDFVKNKLKGNAWLGISRCHEQDSCLLDYSPALWSNWAPGQPDEKPKILPGLKNKNFAVLMQEDGKWADDPKSEKHNYICKKPEDPCQNNFCNPHGSTCVNGKCQCKPGFSGEYCYVEPCDTAPCKNGGLCEVVETDYKCNCNNHYSGKNCEVPPPCQAKKPCVMGVCVNINAVDYRCKCNYGWFGKNCNKRPCDQRPCGNFHKCVNRGSSYKCICLKG